MLATTLILMLVMTAVAILASRASRVHGIVVGLLGGTVWALHVLGGDLPQRLGWLGWGWLVLGIASVAIAGTWSAGTAVKRLRSSSSATTAQDSGTRGHAPIPEGMPAVNRTGQRYPLTADALSRFEEWLERHRLTDDPWPEFGEWLRQFLNHLCQARHVRIFRVHPAGARLVPLHEPAGAVGLAGDHAADARQGIIGHVITTGRSFRATDPANGSLLAQLAKESAEPIEWCFAVSRGTQRIGMVAVGHLPAPLAADETVLRVAASLTTLFWNMLAEVQRSRQAATTDALSGALTREQFLARGTAAIEESYALGEPVAVVAIALEGLRGLLDHEHWNSADGLVTAVSDVLCTRVRADDLLGRFDDSRFLLLLRRVDSALGALIVNQLMARLGRTLGPDSPWAGQIQLRCGVVGSGHGRPSLEDLVTHALDKCHEARRQTLRIASDLSAGESTAVERDSALTKAGRPRAVGQAEGTIDTQVPGAAS